MKKILIALSLLTIVLSFSACRKDSIASVVDGAGNNSTDIVSKVESPTAAPTTTAASTAPVVTTKAEPTAGTGTTTIGTFIITKVSGTYLELNKLDDVEKTTYSCDIGGFDGSADMNYKVGDYIVLRYDQEIMETYPLQLTVREIYPPEWNN